MLKANYGTAMALKLSRNSSHMCLQLKFVNMLHVYKSVYI